MIARPARPAEAGEVQLGGRHKDLLLALAFSLGVHLIVLLTLAASPGDWRHGFQAALRATLREVPRADPRQAAGPTSVAAPAAQENRPMREVDGQAASSAQGASTPLADRYFRTSEVDASAVAVYRGPLVLPELAYVSRLAGTVRARVYISEHGAVDSVQIVEARPRSGVFEAAAIDALRQIRYKPAELAGRAVKSQKVVEVTFNPGDETEAR